MKNKLHYIILLILFVVLGCKEGGPLFNVVWNKIDIDKAIISGRISNIGDANEECVEITAYIRDKDGGECKVKIPIDAKEVEVGESTEFTQELPFEPGQRFVHKFVVKSGPKIRSDGYIFEDCNCRPILGVNLAGTQEIDSLTCKELGIENQTKGIKIIGIISYTPADRCGLREGDVILECDRVKISDISELDSLVRHRQISDTLNMLVLRNKEKLQLSAILM